MSIVFYIYLHLGGAYLPQLQVRIISIFNAVNQKEKNFKKKTY